MEPKLDDIQCGFPRNSSTTEKISILQQIFKKSCEHSKDLYTCFVDLRQERNERGKGAQFTKCRIFMGARNHCGGHWIAKKSQQCHKYSLQYSAFASKRPHIRTWGRQTCFLPRAPCVQNGKLTKSFGLQCIPTGKQPKNCPRTRWRNHISYLFGPVLVRTAEPAELFEIAVNSEVFRVLLGLLLFMKLSLVCLPKVNVVFKQLSIFGRNLAFLWIWFKSIIHRRENCADTLKLHHDTLLKTLNKTLYRGLAQSGKLAEWVPLSTVEGPLANIQKKTWEIMVKVRTWTTIVKPYITGKYSDKRKKQQPTERQSNTKTETLVKWGPNF